MSKAERFEALDAWRGICALVVALEHLPIPQLHAIEFLQRGYRFVDFFFVLSGFVIAHAYRERLGTAGTSWRFMLRRIGRLWPLHVAILVVLILFNVAILVGSHAGISLGRDAFAERDTLSSLPVNLALVHAWGMLDQLTWNGPSWSISAELFAYASFAGICLLGKKAIPFAAAILLVGGALVIGMLAPMGMKSTYDFAIFRCLFGFMTGVLIRQLHGVRPLRIGTIGEAIVVALVVAGVALLPGDGWLALLVTPLFALAVWTFAAEHGALARALRHPWPQALGAWSYSIYMVHATIMIAILAFTAILAKSHFKRVDGVASLVGSTGFVIALTLVYLAIIIVVARFTYRYIELPGQRFFNRKAAT